MNGHGNTLIQALHTLPFNAQIYFVRCKLFIHKKPAYNKIALISLICLRLFGSRGCHFYRFLFVVLCVVDSIPQHHSHLWKMAFAILESINDRDSSCPPNLSNPSKFATNSITTVFSLKFLEYLRKNFEGSKYRILIRFYLQCSLCSEIKECTPDQPKSSWNDKKT